MGCQRQPILIMDIEQGTFEDTPQYKRKTDAEIKEISLGVYKGEIFTSMQVGPSDSSTLGMIFMPLMFMSDMARKAMKRDKIVHLYAPMSSAGPRAINGYPIFSECSFLDEEDARRVADKYNDIVKLMKEF